MTYSTQLIFGTLALGGVAGSHTIESITKTQVPGTLKYSQNGNLIKDEIPGRTKDWQVRISGKLLGTTRDAARATLISYDNGQPRRYEDGELSDDFVIDENTLVFDDSGDDKSVQRYSVVFLQWNQ